ncbi:MAG: hypothetical protein EOO43_21515 [Flavobacterium sp.]|nr:MAG: hypothetical protein EOO43_21515 [Flavobacterium sp.]
MLNNKCPKCGHYTRILYYTFRAPRSKDITSWNVAQYLVGKGFLYQEIYGLDGEIVDYPETMEEAQIFAKLFKNQAYDA